MRGMTSIVQKAGGYEYKMQSMILERTVEDTTNSASESGPNGLDNTGAFKLMKKRSGLSNQEIADRMGVSIHAVNSWLATRTSKSSRVMPDSMFILAQKVICED